MKACIVTGTRHGTTERWLDTIWSALDECDVVIHGGARGIDAIANDAALAKGLAIMELRADWDQRGRAAGPIRNQEMLDRLIDLRDSEHYDVVVLAFHDDLPNSKGTGDMVRRAKAAGIEVRVHE